MQKKEKKYHFIYKTTNLINKKYYIGMHSTDVIEDGYMGSGKILINSIKKHGKENHKIEIIEFIKTREELKKREEEIVNLNEISKEKCMNLMTGGVGGYIGEEQQRKRSIAGGKAFALKLKIDEEFKYLHITNAIKNIKKAHQEGKIKYNTFTGRKHTEETKAKMSKTLKEKALRLKENNSQFGTCWITKDGINKKIKKEELNLYISQGWEKGRIIKN